MTSPTSTPAYPGPAHIPGLKPPGYAEATVLEAQHIDDDASLPAYSPPRPSVPRPRQSQVALFHVERTVRRTRLARDMRSLACFILLAFLLIAVFIVVVIIEIIGHFYQ